MFTSLCCALSNFLVTKPVWLWEKALPLELRCCWINQPIILLGLTPPNLPHDTCRPVAGPNPLYHTSGCPSSFTGRTGGGEFDKWQLGDVIRLWFRVQGVDPGQQKLSCFELKHHSTKSWNAHQTLQKKMSQLPISAKKQKVSLSCTRMVCRYNWSWFWCDDTQRTGQEGWYQDILGWLFRRGNARVYSEHRDRVLISGLGISSDGRDSWDEPWWDIGRVRALAETQ